MPPQAPGTLNERGHGSQIGNHHVKVEIQAGFEHLGAHQHTPRAIVMASFCPIATKIAAQLLFNPLPIGQRIAGMQQIGSDSAPA
jgi:hypothetical protein